MSSSSLKLSTRKILSRWARMGFYVYIRPVTSKFIEPTKKHRVYWSLSVEFRTVPPGQWHKEGFDLDALVKELEEEIATLSQGPCPHVCTGGYPCSKGRGHSNGHAPQNSGYLAPASVTRQEIEAEKEQIRKERPRRRPESKQSRRRGRRAR